jgi:hypothetical protein
VVIDHQSVNGERRRQKIPASRNCDGKTQRTMTHTSPPLAAVARSEIHQLRIDGCETVLNVNEEAVFSAARAQPWPADDA